MYLLVGSTTEQLLIVADYVDMKKKCVDGTLQVFRYDKLELFECQGIISSILKRAFWMHIYKPNTEARV